MGRPLSASTWGTKERERKEALISRKIPTRLNMNITPP
jgi:hypothetical protein